MTTPVHSVAIQAEPTSRRAILAGALGGVGLWAASLIGRADPGAAATGDPVRIGLFNRGGATTTTLQGSHTAAVMRVVQNGSGPALFASSPRLHLDQQRIGVYGHSGRGVGVRGAVTSGWGVEGFSEGNLPESAGVKGECQFGSGVMGFSDEGHGVHGSTAFGYAGYFDGKTFAETLDMPETAPSVPPAGQARLFVRDNGSGKTQLCVQFATGSPFVLAAEA